MGRDVEIFVVVSLKYGIAQQGAVIVEEAPGDKRPNPASDAERNKRIFKNA